MLMNRRALAKISNTPGKTQTINHYLVNKDKAKPWYLVDLPGYGYAKVSKSSRNKWEAFIQDYLLNRTNLVCIFVLIDSRIPPQEIDVQFLYKLGKSKLPFAMVFTKIDKMKSAALGNIIAQHQEKLLKKFEDIPNIFMTSAETHEGRSTVLDFIDAAISSR